MRRQAIHFRWGRRLAAATAVAAAAVCAAAGEMRVYETRYYIIHTDLDEDTAREASARMTAMAEEYYQRTQGFGGVVRKRLRFYLFSDRKDYVAQSGRPGTAGIYDGASGVLMAVVSKDSGRDVWRVVQHEGFHQFVHLMMGGRIPVWVNEGLAEYFSHGVWTGDNFVTGVIEPARLRRVQATIRDGKTLPFGEMLGMSYSDWSSALSGRNYDQAWSMVHFLVHGADGRYRKAFEAFISDASRGAPWYRSFPARFGREATELEDRYKEWWLALEANATADQTTLAVVQTLTSYLARARAAGQKIESVEQFFELADKGELKMPEADWLPPSLLAGAVKQAQTLKTWSLEGGELRPKLTLTRDDGTSLTGVYTIGGGKVSEVRVRVTKAPPPKTPASGTPS